jgi:glucose/arabinose dehydrogenase
MRRPLRAACAVTVFMLTACGGGASSTPPATATATATASPAPSASTTTPSAPASTAAPCALRAQSPPSATIPANFATALAFAPDGRLFYAERAGTVRVWQNGAARTFATVSTVTTESGGGYSERGLLGLAISRSFATDHYVFAFYSDSDYTHQHVIRWTDCAGSATNPDTIVTFPSGNDCCHKGGRLAIGIDGKVYVTLGEEHTAAAAQNTADMRGKVLRYNLDGSVPTDNPFGAQNPVWAYGLRNPFGMAISPSGQMALTNNGPSGDAGSPSTGYDTAILSVARGAGYQWPLCYGYSHLNSGAGSCGTGEIGPDWSSESSTVIPAGVAFVDSAGPAGLAGHVVFCTYGSGMLVLTPGSPHASVSGGASTCRLDVTQGPDHAVYYSDSGHIYRQA